MAPQEDWDRGIRKVASKCGWIRMSKRGWGVWSHAFGRQQNFLKNNI